ncbi:dynamin family protein [Streptomyces erythrochromogenes]|uniref:dynamin family protein n=1 Tax=Streptomyces erythrochromogenes TaxID=285574 RepID=UPI0036C8F89B
MSETFSSTGSSAAQTGGAQTGGAQTIGAQATGTPTGSKLADVMRRGAEQARDEADQAIEGLAEVARELEMRETAGRLSAIASQLRSDTFNLMVMGRFKTGKSTLLNALLGGTTGPVDLGGQSGPMVVDDLPATATLTGVCYAEQPYVTQWGFDGSSEKWTLERYLRESTLDIDEEETSRRFRTIREFEMGFPSRLCQAGVVVYDSPGLDEHPTRTKVTQEATARCDAAVLVYRSDILMGHGELMNAGALVKDGTRVFTVVNLFNGRAVDERLRGYVWNKYIRDYQGGPAYTGQDLTSRDIYFVDAAQARSGVYEGKPELVERSGLAALERRLGDFLLRDRHHVHLTKYTTVAAASAESVEQHIAQRMRAARTDQVRLRETYTELLPAMASIRNRPALLPALFNRYRTEAEAVLAVSFASRIASMRDGLPAHIDAVEVKMNLALGVFQQKKAAAVIGEAVQQYVTDQLADWADVEAQRVLEPILGNLAHDVEGEIAAIGDGFGELHLRLTGWETAPERKPLVGTAERVLSMVAGFALGGLGGAVGGGTSGFRGALGGAGGVLGAGMVLGLLGVSPAAPLVVPVLLAASLLGGAVGGGVNLEKRLKRRLATDSDGLLRDLPGQLAPHLGARVRASFEELEEVVTAEINGVIGEEEQHIRAMVEENQRDQHERDLLVARLDAVRSTVSGHLLRLQKAISTAQQI